MILFMKLLLKSMDTPQLKLYDTSKWYFTVMFHFFVIVSHISTFHNLQTVSRPADMTSGTVNILDPTELMRQIRLISQNPVIATNVEVYFILHPALMFDKKTDTSVRMTEVLGVVPAKGLFTASNCICICDCFL